MKNQKITKLQVNTWYGKKFTSASNLVDLYHNKVIERVSVGRTEGMHWWRETYNYLTHDGRFIAQITHNSDFGPCTQAYGVELKNVISLVNDNKRKIDSDVWMCDYNFLQDNRKYHVLRRLSKGQTIKQYYYPN